MRCREGIFQELHGKTGPLESKPRRRASLNSGGAPGASSGSQSDPIRTSTPAPPPRLHLNTSGSEKTRRWRRPRWQTLTQQSNQAMVDGTVALSSTSEVKRDFFEPHVFLHFTQKTPSSLFTIISYWYHGKQLVLSDEVGCIRTRSNAQIGLSLLSFFTFCFWEINTLFFLSQQLIISCELIHFLPFLPNMVLRALGQGMVTTSPTSAGSQHAMLSQAPLHPDAARKTKTMAS